MRGNFELEQSQYPVAVAHVGLNDIQVVNLTTSQVHLRETKQADLVGRKEQVKRLNELAAKLNREIRQQTAAAADIKLVNPDEEVALA